MQNFQKILLSKENRIYIEKSGAASRGKFAFHALSNGQSTVVVCSGKNSLRTQLALTKLFIPSYSEEDLFEKPLWEKPVIALPELRHLGTKQDWTNLIAVFFALTQNKPFCLLIDVQNLLFKFMPTGFYVNRSIDFTTGNDFSPDLISDQAIEWGYERVQLVTKPGELARRGDILDIFPTGYSRPVRMEFFGDVIEDMRFFDPENQRSLKSVNEFKLLPAAFLQGDVLAAADTLAYWEKLREEGRFSENIHYDLKKNIKENPNCLLPGMIWNDASRFEEWITGNTTWILPNESILAEEMILQRSRLQEVLESGSNCIQPVPMTLRRKSSPAPWNGYKCVLEEPLISNDEKIGIELPERTISQLTDLLPSEIKQNRPWKTLSSTLKKWGKEKKQVLLCFSTERGRKNFLSMAEEDGIQVRLHYQAGQKGIFALQSSFQGGIDIVWDNSIILGEEIIFPRLNKTKRIKTGAFKGLERFNEIKEGDLLVHRDYGIGRFLKLEQLEINSTHNDFIILEYSGHDKLYLPADRLNLIQKFKGSEGIEPPLDRLGGQLWQAGKEKARKAIEKIAADLVEMYAYRKVAKGFHYDPPGSLYREFEATFNYEETPDQARAIQDVLDDMERKEPMDRLVCGDVGFGKTEVALRAAFRAAAEGRQAVFLCPTTVLAEQHYQTFQARLSGFPINVGLLSRFVSKARQKEVLKACESGQIDILVGTHRVLSNDVKLPNLSLLILDEEQRFGVRHKEKLKELKKNVDVLTLTATPIPRTLQLSMSGIRDLSIIETAPQDRKAVASAVLKRDGASLQKILEREIAREGQVFWVYNRVNGLERVVEYVKKLVPDARVGVAHGQLSESELEDTMRKFLHGELDVLVSTSIVESGLDFPRANTMIIDQAQMFGLGQLYQLRGRVGRSDKQAYAYFVVPDEERLSSIAEERLRIILEMDYLGAGFQLAMEDLRLRGAGNILGEVQTGHMSRIGLDLYLEMLEEAVGRIKGEPLKRVDETELNLGLNANLPASYIDDTKERLHFYRTLTRAENEKDRQEIAASMRDRFGPLPGEAQNFLAVLSFKQILSSLKVKRADININYIRLFWPEEEHSIDPNKIIKLVEVNKNMKLLPPAGLSIPIKQELAFPESLQEIGEALECLQN